MLDFLAIIKFNNKNYLLFYKQKYLLYKNNDRFSSHVNFNDYKITKIVDKLIMNLIVDDEYTKTIFVLFIIIKFIKQHLSTIINEFITENYVKLLIIINNEKNHKNIEKTIIHQSVKDSKLINKMEITLFIELINEFINFIDLIQARSRKTRDTFISKINSISKSQRLYHFDYFSLFLDNLSKTEINSFKTRDRSTYQIQSITKFKSHHFFIARIATLIVNFLTKYVKTNDELFMIETKSFIE